MLQQSCYRQGGISMQCMLRESWHGQGDTSTQLHQPISALPLTSQGLLPNEPLCLPIELLNELSRQKTCVQNLYPASNPILHKTQLQDLCFFLCPARGGCEVPPAVRVEPNKVLSTADVTLCDSKVSNRRECTYNEAASPTFGPLLFSDSRADMLR